MQGKGNIMIDDIAKGITYNKEPYTSNKKFSVITPDIPSQLKFFTVNNYTHKYLEKEKRSPFVEYTPKKTLIEAYEEALRPSTSRIVGPSSFQNTERKVESVALTERIPVKEQSKVKNTTLNADYVTNHMRSSSGAVKPGTSIPGKRLLYNSQPFRRKRRIHIPKNYAVYSPRELYTPTGESVNAPFYRSNPFVGTRYYNMLSLLNLDKTKTLRDVLMKSQEAESSTQRMLRLQKDEMYLTSQGLSPVPKKRLNLEIRGTQVLKNMSKKIFNDFHGRITNRGYARTNYGGYFTQ